MVAKLSFNAKFFLGIIPNEVSFIGKCIVGLPKIIVYFKAFGAMLIFV